MKPRVFALMLSLLFLRDCGNSHSPLGHKDCAGYQLDNIYFTDTSRLVYQVFVQQIYEDSMAFSVEQIQAALDSMSVNLRKDSISFEVVGTRTGKYWIEHGVIDTFQLLPLSKISVANFESFTELDRRNALTLYLIPDNDQDFNGNAGVDVPSVHAAVQRQYIGTSSAIHELTHCLGCLHIHLSDMTDGYNTKTGDKVCDTPSCPELNADLTRFCAFMVPGLNKEKSDLVISNIMSSSASVCRRTITEGQAARIKKVTELNPSIRRCLKRAK